MPRWPIGYVSRNVCPQCGGKKYWSSALCRECAPQTGGHDGKSGAVHPAWKGGFRIDRDGYIRTYAPTHPWPRRGGYIHEHVRIMELHLGRRLLSSEDVHHKDHDRKHNELSNLELMTKSEHSKHHRKLDTNKRKRNKGRFC